MTIVQTPLPIGWRWAKLAEVAEINPRRPAHLVRNDSAPTTFIPMAAVDDYLGIVARPEVRPYSLVKKGYTYFSEGDVLFAKITPCMENGKHAIAYNLIDRLGFGSTEFHVIRPTAQILAPWIHHFLRQPVVLDAAAAHFTGAVGQQRVPPDYLSALDMPLPPVDEQQRLSALLNEQMSVVEQARAAADSQMGAARNLPSAFLRSIFSSTGASLWPRIPLGEVCSIVARQVDPKLPQYGALPHVNGENIESGTCRLLYLNTAAQEGMISGKYLFEPGDVLYSKLRPYLRKVAYADFQGVCSADMYPIKVNDTILDSHFLAWLLLSDDFTQYAIDESRRARMPKLNRDQLFGWLAPIPPLADQRNISRGLNDQMRAVFRLQSLAGRQIDYIDQLPAKLLSQAFDGGF